MARHVRARGLARAGQGGVRRKIGCRVAPADRHDLDQRPLPRDAAKTESIIRRYTTAYTIDQATGKVTYLLANPAGLAADEHPYIPLLSQDLLDAKIDVVALRTS